jgi:hypothetical protein
MENTMMVTYAARILVVTVYVALALYVTTGVGMFGPRALAINHALADRAFNGFTNIGERYFQTHPIPAVPIPAQQASHP